MSATRTLRKPLVNPGSAGVPRLTPGLSSVGPPPVTRVSHVLATFMMTGSPASTTCPPGRGRGGQESELLHASLVVQRHDVLVPPGQGAVGERVVEGPAP